MRSEKLITLYGNVGGDPEVTTLPERTGTYNHYDAIIDEVVERDFTTPRRDVRRFSLAVTAKVEGGADIKRWIPCDDWDNRSTLVRKGDRLRVDGYFKVKTYTKKEEQKTIRIFVVKDLKIEHAKARQEVP